MITRILLATVMALFPEGAHADDSSAALTLLALGLLVLIIYFLPTVVAFNRVHPNRWVILALNIFLGSTGIVWLICLIWALRAVHMADASAASNGGESGLNIFANDEKKVRIVNQVDAEQQSIVGGKPPDLAIQITRLKKLLDSGAISQSEFADLKRKLITGPF